MRRSLPNPENECQWSVNDVQLWILGKLNDDWMLISINKVLAIFIGKINSNTLPVPSWKWASTEQQLFAVLQLG